MSESIKTDFELWLEELDAAALRISQLPNWSQQTGVECWREDWLSGLSPTEAFLEDIRYAN